MPEFLRSWLRPILDSSDRERRDAARLAIQSALSAALLFIGMRAAGLPEKFVGVLSAVLVVQPSVGNTLVQARQRVVSTLIGCAIGVACLSLLPAGYGTAIALTLSMLVMNGLAGFQPEWRYGVVAAVALSLGSESDLFQTAIERSVAIGLGVACGAIVTLTIWPDKASKRAERFLGEALRAAADRLTGAVRATSGEIDRDQSRDTESKTKSRYHANVQRARSAAESVRIADNESLLKKIDALERFHHAVTILNRVAAEAHDESTSLQLSSQKLSAVRKASCEVAVGLADGQTDHRERLQQLERAIDELKQDAQEDVGDRTRHMLRNALAFALDECFSSLRELAELYDAEEED